MLALTVRQPYAWAILRGGKNVENRGWLPNPERCPPGTRIAIHSAAKLMEDYPLHVERITAILEGAHETANDIAATVLESEAPEALRRLQKELEAYPDRCPDPATLPLGQILGTVVVERFERELDSPWVLGNAKWKWVLRDPKVLRVPVKCPGSQMLWEFEAAGMDWGALT